MRIIEVLNAIPEADRAALVAELRSAKSADELAEIAKKHDLNIDAQAVYDKLAISSTEEMSDDDLDAVAGGSDCSSSDVPYGDPCEIY